MDAPPNALWKRAYSAVLPNSDIASAQGQLKKLVNERFGRAGGIEVNEQDWSIRTEVVSMDRIKDFERKHNRASPRQFDGPLVAAEFRACQFLIDGTNRVNRWLLERSSREHEVLIISFLGRANDD